MTVEVKTIVNSIEVRTNPTNKVEVATIGKRGPKGDKGDQGDPAPDVLAQYSVDADVWDDEYNEDAEHIRFSYDGGSNYGPAMKFKGADGSPGDSGSPGDPGADGADGKTILSGSGAPASALGEDGDFYLDVSAMEIYGPKSGTWGAGVSLIGPAGEGVPAIGSGDSGRVLAVKTDESGAEWIDPPSGGSGGVSLGLVIALS